MIRFILDRKIGKMKCIKSDKFKKKNSSWIIITGSWSNHSETFKLYFLNPIERNKTIHLQILPSLPPQLSFFNLWCCRVVRNSPTHSLFYACFVGENFQSLLISKSSCVGDLQDTRVITVHKFIRTT